MLAGAGAAGRDEATGPKSKGLDGTCAGAGACCQEVGCIAVGYCAMGAGAYCSGCIPCSIALGTPGAAIFLAFAAAAMTLTSPIGEGGV